MNTIEVDAIRETMTALDNIHGRVTAMFHDATNCRGMQQIRDSAAQLRKDYPIVCAQFEALRRICNLHNYDDMSKCAKRTLILIDKALETSKSLLENHNMSDAMQDGERTQRDALGNRSGFRPSQSRAVNVPGVPMQTLGEHPPVGTPAQWVPESNTGGFLRQIDRHIVDTVEVVSEIDDVIHDLLVAFGRDPLSTTPDPTANYDEVSRAESVATRLYDLKVWLITIRDHAKTLQNDIL